MDDIADVKDALIDALRELSDVTRERDALRTENNAAGSFCADMMRQLTAERDVLLARLTSAEEDAATERHSLEAKIEAQRPIMDAARAMVLYQHEGAPEYLDWDSKFDAMTVAIERLDGGTA